MKIADLLWSHHHLHLKFSPTLIWIAIEAYLLFKKRQPFFFFNHIHEQ